MFPQSSLSTSKCKNLSPKQISELLLWGHEVSYTQIFRRDFGDWKKKAMSARLGTPGGNWELACPHFPISATHCVFSPLYKPMWKVWLRTENTQKSIHCFGFLPQLLFFPPWMGRCWSVSEETHV